MKRREKASLSNKYKYMHYSSWGKMLLLTTTVDWYYDSLRETSGENDHCFDVMCTVAAFRSLRKRQLQAASVAEIRVESVGFIIM